MTSRRQFLKAGLAATLLLTSVSRLNRARGEGQSATSFGFLTSQDQLVLAAIIPVMLPMITSTDFSGKVDEKEIVIQGVDRAILGLPEYTQSELRELFDLLGFAPTRMLVAGLWSDWGRVSSAEVERFLTRWRLSRYSLLKSGYDGLHELIFAAFYGNPLSWNAIGYPGPPEVVRE